MPNAKLGSKRYSSKHIGEVLTRVSSPVTLEKNKEYREIGIRSHCKGIFHKESVTGDSIGSKRVFWVEPNCLVFNIVFAWEHAVALTSDFENGLIASHRFPMYKVKNDELLIEYAFLYFTSSRGKYDLGVASPGGAGRNKTLGQEEFKRLKMLVPPIEYQEKAVKTIEVWNRAIGATESLLKEKYRYKNAIAEKMLNAKLRFASFKDEWVKKEIGLLLNYEQPTKYIAEDLVEYEENKIPVLTANKSFVLGSTDEKKGVYSKGEAIIFDDFTTNCKFVDFDFKVRSSAIKILTPKDDSVNLKFMYERFKRIVHPKDVHKRYYLSEYQIIPIMIPTIKEQEKISEVFNHLDSEINIIQKKLILLRKQKRGLMQKLLTGEIPYRG